jgi:hypothetical protein
MVKKKVLKTSEKKRMRRQARIGSLVITLKDENVGQ